MAIQQVEADTLIVGAGAMGMAYADVVLSERPAERLVIVDRHARPGGHWNDAYSFVSLHQPAAYYGVCSEPLGSGGAELASGAEVLAYYERVAKKFQRTGRVQYFPMCEVHEDGRIVSIVDPDREIRVQVSGRRVDATYMNVEVPSVRGPQYDVAPGASVVPLNDLARVREPYGGYVVIGSGKTGMDAVLFLLDQGVDPAHVRWISPNDAWLLDRAQIQPGRSLENGFSAQLENVAQATSIDDLFRSLERDRRILRLDPDVWPTKYRCATVSQEELVALRKVEDVVRMGRVLRIDPGEIVLERGTVPTGPKVLHVDCTADGLARRAAKPVFGENELTLQSLFMCQQVFSAAAIAHIDGMDRSVAEKNALCSVVPHPEVSRDFVACMSTTFHNLQAWMPVMGRWLRRCRLNLGHHESTWKLLKSFLAMRKVLPAALENMERLLGAEAADPRR